MRPAPFPPNGAGHFILPAGQPRGDGPVAYASELEALAADMERLAAQHCNASHRLITD